ncbi:SusC/RagA family TonB-linked outer membrane protein [Chitinophaga ginsengisoli]|nr:SusC/RagA family TonB-linked outer membrane protein [Chitinophaga ginsengisoli]
MKKTSLTCSQLVRGIAVILMCFCAAGTSSAQAPEREMRFTFSKDSMELGEAIDSMKKWTDFYRFETNDVDLKQMAPVGYRNISVPELLEIWHRQIQLDYTIQGRYVGFKAGQPVARKPPLIDILYGTVIDKKRRPVYKASVRVNSGGSGTTTDPNGSFSLFHVMAGTAISISCVGYVTHDTTVPGNAVLDVTLEEQTNIVKPFEVTGNKPKKHWWQDSTYRFPNVKEITMGAQFNMVDDLSGKAPGVVLQRGNGRAAATRSTEIRGPTSLNRNSQALYVIDGVIIVPDFKGGEGTMSQYSSTLSYLSTADIDTIIVLKSAVATALYGARGANGVVQIFTKKATHTDKTHFMADVSYSFGKVPHHEHMLNTDQYIQLRWDAWNNDGLSPTSKKAPDMLDWDQYRYTDWQKELIGHTAYYKDAVLTLSGERAAFQYRISGNFRENSTPYMREGNQYGDLRYGLHGSTNIKLLNDRLHISLTGLANNNRTRLPGTDYTMGISLPPNAPPLFKDGKINYALSNSIVSLPDFEGHISNMLITTSMNYHVNSWMSFLLTGGYHRMGAHNTSISTIAKRGEEGQANLTASSTENRYLSQTIDVEPSVQFNLRCDSHKVGLNLGGVYNSIYAGNTTIDASGYLRDQDILHYETIGTVKRTPSANRYKYAGAHAHLNYDWKERYTLELVLRLDGSSRFGKDEQVNLFGGGAAGWEFGREAFVRHALPGLSYGKLQVGWSATGNDQIDDYQYAGSYQPAGSYQAVEGLMAAKQQNSALTGGMTYKKDLTLNLGLLDNKLEIEAAYYHNRSRHQLVEYPLPEMAGGGTIQRNMPVAIQNIGVELTLNAGLVQCKHWSLAVRLNGSTGTNTLFAFEGMTAAPSGQTQLKRPLRELFYYNFYGIDPKSGEALYRNAAGNIVNAAALTENDRIVAINTAPRFYGGFGITCTVDGVEITCSGQYMVRTAENAIIDKQHMIGTMWNQNIYVADRWREAGDNKSVQKATQASSEADQKKYLNSSDIFMDVRYIRINNLTVARQIGPYRVYCNVSNLVTFTNYPSLDPETLSRTALPFMRITKVGVQYYFK